MIFSYNWLQSFFNRKLPNPQSLAEILSDHFAQVEEVKDTGRDFLLDIDIRPNRASDCFSHLGIAREISAILNFKLKIKKETIKEEEMPVKKFFDLLIKDKEACHRYTARVVFDLKIGPSPFYIKEKLENCGLRSINNVVDITNYVMLETGQPLHAFDLQKIEDKKIIVRFAKEKEKIITLDNEEYELGKDVLLISDNKKPLAIAGIKGAVGAEVDSKTKTIVLESANFNPLIIRKGSRKIDLKTDASWRFEHGIDPNLTEFAVNKAAFLIQEVAGAKVAKGMIDFYPQPFISKVIKLDLKLVEDLLGIKIPLKKVEEIIKRLNFKVKKKEKEFFEVEIPTYRQDINYSQDLVEEIGRIYGYDKISPSFPFSVLVPPEKNLKVFWEEKTKDILKETGFTEVYSYSFISEKEAEIFDYHKKNLIEIENPVSADYKYLRPSLIPTLLKIFKKNEKKNYSSQDGKIKIFEISKIFYPPHSEKTMLVGLIEDESFYYLKGIIDFLLEGLGISNSWYDEWQATPEESNISIWHSKNTAEIKIGDKEIGFLGELSPKILQFFKIEKKIFVFEIEFEKLSQLASEEQEFRPISPFPAAVRDIAVLVPKWVKAEEVLNKIELAGGELVVDIDLFDYYEGEELPEGKKSFAFHIVFQAKDRVLDSKEIDQIQERIFKALEKEKNWEVRK